jgi:hypothetical protein
MSAIAVHRQDQSQAGSLQNAWLQVAHEVRSTSLQGLEHVGQIEDFGKINIFAAIILTRYQAGLIVASYEEAMTM